MDVSNLSLTLEIQSSGDFRGSEASWLLLDEIGVVRARGEVALTAATLDHAAMAAAAVGLRRAYEMHAGSVQVLSDLEEVISRLALSRGTEWSEPIAAAWREARALSHCFADCRFVRTDVTPRHSSLIRAA